MHTRLCRHSVNNIKRVVVVESTYTTYAHSGSARGRTVSRDVHAWDTTLKCLDGIVLVLLLQLVNAHHRYGTGKVGLALCGVTRHHHFLEVLHVLLDHNLHARGSRQFLCQVTDVADDESGPTADRQLETAVNVRSGTIGGTLLHHRGSDDGFARLIHHLSRSLNLLRVKYGTHHTQERECS